jgi:hypothetical protein
MCAVSAAPRARLRLSVTLCFAIQNLLNYRKLQSIHDEINDEVRWCDELGGLCLSY